MKSITNLFSLIAIFVIALSPIGGGIAGFSHANAMDNPAPLAAGETEAVSKTGVAGTMPGGGIGSQTIDWSIDYDLTSAAPLSNLTLTDTWSAGQTLVPGSVQTPGGTWNYSQPNGTSINFTNALIAPNGQGSGIPLSIPLSGPINFSGAGDGFNPAITESGKILGINHHANNAGIWCYDTISEGPCADYKMFPGINTTTASIVRAIGNKIYIIGSDIGTGSNTQPGYIYCWDTANDSLCGTSPHLTAFDRLAVGNNGLLYTLLATGEIDCFDPDNALARCIGYPIQVNVPAAPNNLGNGILPVGNNLYVLNWNGQINCINLSTLAFCSGWSPTPLAGPLAKDILFPRLNAGGSIIGICQVGAGTAADCYDLDGANHVSISEMSLVVSAGTYSFGQDNDYYGSRVYFGGYQNNLGCWDWATSAPCAGAGFDANGHTTNSALNNSLIYAISHDAGCLYTFGDAGSLFSVDPITGQTPCSRSTGQVTVDIDDFYGATTPGSVSANWDKVSLTDINLTSGSEFNSLVVTVINPSDNSTVAGPSEMIDTLGEIDLSGVSSDIRELKLQVVAEPVGTTAWADSIDPKIWLTFASNTPVQFSYQTTITCAGSSQTATNTINTTLDPHSDQATVTNLCTNNHTVTFDANGGTGSMSSQVASAPTVLTANSFTRSSYTFTGWNTAANGSGTPYANGASYSFASDVTLYAQWSALANHTVIFNANGGSGSMSNQVTNVPTALTTNTFTRSGYTFTGWNTAANGSGTDYANGASYDFAADVTLYAQWSATGSTLIIKSVALNDGWVLESSETSNLGGFIKSDTDSIVAGDDAADRQYRSFLHFDTSALPDNAVITSVVLRLYEAGTNGSDPFLSLGQLRIDMIKPAFGAAGVELADFEAVSPRVNIGSITEISPSLFSSTLNNAARNYLNKTGTTQFRIYFAIDDNDNATSDFIRFFSGEASSENRPKLIITYTTP
jgi:uncharacterized repeat protein (TIGR02543 family)